MSLFDVVTPRRDVLDGELTEARFAASLEEVVTGSAPEAYGDPKAFFASTYPSGGLKSLLNEAIGRVTGGRPDAASVIRLETNLGGGKTHNLIALYHAVRGGLAPEQAADLMDPALLPKTPIKQVGVFVGTSSGASSFPAIDGVAAKTIWGYLALQLGGESAYALVQADDESLTAPGSDAIKRLLGDEPSLILIDEIARYYAVAKGVEVGQTTLAGQTTAFLMALMEAVDALPNASLVITTTGLTDAFGENTADVLTAIDEARELMARKELVLRPSDEADLPKILARRLFDPIPAGAASAAGQAYAVIADAAFNGGLDLPESMTGAGWASEVASTYPFHPRFIQVLDKRLSTIPNFQRTRGALRLLARVVRDLWRDKPEGTELIHLHHVNLADKVIAEELSSRLERPAFEPVIRADIATQGNEPSHADAIDKHMGNPYAHRLATGIYLYSLTRDVPGVPAAELYGATLSPGDDPNLIQRSLDALENACWYLHADIRGFRFSTEASLVKLIQEAETEISITKARTEATSILAQRFKDAALKVKRAWEDAKVPDSDEDAWLVILHWDDFGDQRGVDPQGAVPTKVKELWDRTPSGGIREYRNRLVILAPSQASHDAMVRAVRTRLALVALDSNPDILAALTPDKREELKNRRKESELLAQIAVCNHVNVLYVPAANGLDSIELDVVTQASAKPNQTDSILDRLASMEKTLTTGSKPLDPGYVKTKLGELLQRAQPTKELVRAFARRPDLKMVLDRAQLVALVGAGIRNGVWEYHDPERGDAGWATKDRPNAAVRLAEDTFIYPPGSAPPPQQLACPLCGAVHPGTTCAGGGGGGTPPPPPPAPGTLFFGAGSAGKAFADARAAAAEAGRHDLKQISISIDHVGAGAGTELTRLHTVVNPSALGVKLHYEVDVTAVLTDPNDSVHIRFQGSPAEYAPLREALKQLLGPRQATLKASVKAVWEEVLPLSGDAVNGIAQAATDTGPTKCEIAITTEDTA